MGIIIAVVNQKGGVGKTTTAVNLAAALTERGLRVLVCDFDPQANATSGLGVDKRKAKHTSYHMLIGQSTPQQAVVHTQYADVIPSSADLAGAGVELIGMDHRERQLREDLNALREAYDLILIDCPPSLEMLTLNGLVAADGILIPVQCEYYALEGVSALMGTIQKVQRINRRLNIEGVVLTMLDARTNLGLQVAKEVRKVFKGKVYSTVIPRNVRLGEAPSHGTPIHLYDPRSLGAQSYQALAREFLAR